MGDGRKVSIVRDVYSAVADPTRRELLRMLADADELSLHELTAPFKMGRTAISKHLGVLKEAGLVDDRRVGRETRYRLNPVPLREIQHWVSSYERFWSVQIDRLKSLVEEEPDE
jgi:DNA-binding transcriptional ArsR family regulator